MGRKGDTTKTLGFVVSLPVPILPYLFRSPFSILWVFLSFGCVFYFLLTGLAPFASATAKETARRQMWEQPPRVERFRPDVPAEVAALVQRLLAKHPSPHKGRKSKPHGRESVPLWMTAILLVVVLLSTMGIGEVLRTLVK